MPVLFYAILGMTEKRLNLGMWSQLFDAKWKKVYFLAGKNLDLLTPDRNFLYNHKRVVMVW